MLWVKSLEHRSPASSSGASFSAWERRVRNASDWWWTTRDHRKVTDSFKAEKRNEHAWTFSPRSPGRVWKNGGISSILFTNLSRSWKLENGWSKVFRTRAVICITFVSNWAFLDLKEIFWGGGGGILSRYSELSRKRSPSPLLDNKVVDYGRWSSTGKIKKINSNWPD